MQDSKKAKALVVEDLKPAEIDKNGQLILTEKHKQLIKDQIAPDATPAELQLFFMMAHRTRLDPLLKQLYFIKYGRGDRAKVSYVTSIDGYRIIAHRTGKFAGIDEPRYQMNNAGQLENCTITVYRKDSERGFSATVYFKEYNTSMNLWQKMPMTMIAKVAEAHALRKAFPQDLSGVYTTDEMDQASNPTPAVTTRNTTARPQAQTSRPAQSRATGTTKTLSKVSAPQVKYIHSLLKQKGKSMDTIYQSCKITSLNELSRNQASGIIDRLMKMSEPGAVQNGAVQEGEVISKSGAEDVDPDEVDAGMKAEEETQQDLNGNLDESPRAMTGEIRLFEVVVGRRAKQSKKSYETMLKGLLKKFEVVRLEDMSQKQIKAITDQVIRMNKEFETAHNKEADDVAAIVGGEVTK